MGIIGLADPFNDSGKCRLSPAITLLEMSNLNGPYFVT